MPLVGQPLFERLRVCDECGHHFPITVGERIAGLLDHGSFVEMDRGLISADPLNFHGDEPYRDKLSALQRERRQGDAAISGRGTLHGYPVVVFALDFTFMGGSMGVVVGEKLARAVDVAVKERRALVSVSASGGARMQEGLFSLLQMAKTAAAVELLRAEGLPFLSILTNPTTGGVFASFASLGDLIIAEPKALIGFAGPRVAEQVLGKPLPPGSHTAEFLLAHGQVDAVVARTHHRSFVGLSLSALMGRDTSHGARRPETGPLTVQPIWETVEAARDPVRPTALTYLNGSLDTWFELHGDRQGVDDRAVIAGLGFLDGQALALIALERGSAASEVDRRGGRPMPGGYRKAQRLLRLADRFDLPVVSLIDTPGAYPGIESEEQALAGEIARTMALMVGVRPATIAVIIGEGGSGGALAMAVADRVLIQEHAIDSVISPEAAAVILYRDPSRAPELAERLRITASDVRAMGFADSIVREPAGTAKADPDGAALILRGQLSSHLDELTRENPPRRRARRRAKYRAMGSSHVRESAEFR